jgi:sirohydrochlorin ferrochelatase
VSADPPLVLAAHGSADARYAQVVERLATIVADRRPNLDVRIGYLDHGPPDLSVVCEGGAVVVPVLLTSGYHVRADIPQRAPGALVTSAIGPERRITRVLVARLHEAGWSGQHPVVLAATGSADHRALADVHQAARDLGDELGANVEAGFLSAGEPRLADLAPAAVATYLLAPGYFADVVRECGAGVVAEPLGADPRLAEIIVERYDAALVVATTPEAADE